jgi:putative N6-adenine-specific DNA methylase
VSKFFATCARGLEEVLGAELTALGCTNLTLAAGGVQFEGDQSLLYKSHLWLRTANRILLQLRSFPCRSPEDLYENLKKFKWETFFSNDQTFSIDCTISGRNSPDLNHSHYARLKAKDALVDRLREKTGKRPDVNLENPDLRVILYIRDGNCTLNLDASGSSLHERGYRSDFADAPLKETLAAGILLLMDWRGDRPLLDPMCGSGTLLAEGALIAANIAPGLLREKFLFMNWPDFYEPRWRQLVEEARAAQRPVAPGTFFGRDRSKDALKQTQFAFRKIGLGEAVDLLQQDFFSFTPPEVRTPGMLVVNPPYGERLGDVEELKPLYKHLGDSFKQKLKGWNAGVFTGSSELAKCVGLKTKRRIPLWNGAIECRLLTYEMY